MAVCSLDEGLLPINFYACNFIGRLAYHDFEGVTVRPQEGERLLANLGDRNILMLRHHGPVVLAPTVPSMFLQMWALQRACEIQVATLSMGRPVTPIAPEVVAVHQRDLRDVAVPGSQPGATDFAAWVRRIDRVDRSWRD
jgi:ribulose-5-phosphate 4-epimerase/fuculose-1-phosphate aldolase